MTFLAHRINVERCDFGIESLGRMAVAKAFPADFLLEGQLIVWHGGGVDEKGEEGDC